MEWVDANGSGFPVFSFYRGCGHGVFLQLTPATGRNAAAVIGAHSVAWNSAVCAGPISEWLSQSLLFVLVAGLWGIAADCGLLCDLRNSGPVAEATGMDYHGGCLPGRVLDPDAICAGAR